jgi:hypothetical protein
MTNHNKFIHSSGIARLVRDSCLVPFPDPKSTRIHYTEWEPTGADLASIEKNGRLFPANDICGCRGLRGLNNLGNTCFMSVILQARPWLVSVSGGRRCLTQG